MAFAPVVTGISPKEGPPGTRVTVRGENLGLRANDIISVTICDCDCTLSAEWKSPNKVIARSGPGRGRGEIIITTKSGGVGTSTVQFRGYHEAIGPTKESAVWVEEASLHTLSWSRRSLSPTSYQQEDPLGLSVEGNDKKLPEDDLHELFPEGSGDLTSDNFIAGWFLLEHHHTTSFDDLRAGLSFLRRKVEGQKEGQLSFLKSNVGSVMDQLDTLLKLKEKIEQDEKDDREFTERLEEIIKTSMNESNQLFQEVLARRDRADATRNALSVLQRYKFLFCLPSTIERNVQKGDFDLVINDYARVKNLFGNTEIPIFKKVLSEIEERINYVRNVLRKKLDDIPPTIEDHIKVIRSLINLEMPGDPSWIGIECYSNYVSQTMNDIKDRYIVAETTSLGKKDKSGKKLEAKSPASAFAESPASMPQRVVFIEELVEFMESKFPDLWKLGQCYFSGELCSVTDHGRRPQYKNIVLNVIEQFCNLLRAAILPQTLTRNTQMRHMYGIWSNHGLETIIPWLPHCLRYVRSCYSSFIRLDLPSDALDIFSRLIFDLRLHCMITLLRQAADGVSQLYKKENWSVDLHISYGGITDLPTQFEKHVKDVIQVTHDSVLLEELREMPLFENPTARKEISSQVQQFFLNFTKVFEILAFVHDEDDGGHHTVISQLIGSPEIHKGSNNSGLNWEQRLLIIMCNCRYTSEYTLPRIFEAMKISGYPAMTEVCSIASESLTALHQKIVDHYLEQKCDPLVGTIEPSMYLSKFDWDTVEKPTNIRPYAKEIIMNLIGVRSELFRVPSDLVIKIMCKIVDTVAEELARLMTCVKGFSLAGSIQARADILAVKEATKSYATSRANRFYKEALENIPVLDGEGDVVVASILKKFRSNMHLQISCLKSSEMPC